MDMYKKLDKYEVVRSKPLFTMLAAVWCIAGVYGASSQQSNQQNDKVSIFERSSDFRPVNEIDSCILSELSKRGIKPANLCSDSVFIRRVHLDIAGTLPDAQEVRRFLENPRSDKRAALINTLLESDEFAQYTALKWCDLLRVKSEFPINLWPNAVQAYHRWIYDALAANMPYDTFARQLLTSSGSNFRNPPVNFYRAVQDRDPSAVAAAAALAFMGVRLEKWPQERRSGIEVFFSQIGYKGTAEWKEEIVYPKPAESGPLTGVFPDGQPAVIQPNQDPREVFANWLIRADNPWFARCAVNRIWSWLMGHGIIDPPDDIGPDNPPVYPDVLAFLEKELVRSGYDLRHIYRLILNSRTYQQSCIPQAKSPDAQRLFACYPVSQLDAEVLMDALCQITGTQESYSSPVPEPFTFIPDENRSIALADSSITSPFLELFGRPARDTGLQSERTNLPTDAQRLHLLNSSHIQNKIERGPHLRQLMRAAGRNRRMLVDTLYLSILSRFPEQTERSIIEDYFNTQGLTPAQAVNDLVWALINTKEFLYRH
ncbi:MAG: DUF1553 domain-containing protein [Phycisphaerae bacterium]|nr:DUF1553 domain-containing protein [Phycisphaerae bacterium]